MNERVGILAAVLSSTFGGMAAAVTRFVIGVTDPITLAALRFGLGFVCLFPLAVARRSRWPPRKDWVGVALLGVLFFAIFFVLYNAALRHTTAARGTLALSILPLLTMVVAGGLGIEPLTGRKTVGVLVAVAGVATALATGLADAPAGAWRGDLVMVGAALCMALYNVWSRPFIVRSGPLPFVTAGMGIGAAGLVLIAGSTGGFAVVHGFGARQWWAIVYLGLFGAALTFFLWVFALERTTPTRVASTITVNPVAASILAAILLGGADRAQSDRRRRGGVHGNLDRLVYTPRWRALRASSSRSTAGRHSCTMRPRRNQGDLTTGHRARSSRGRGPGPCALSSLAFAWPPRPDASGRGWHGLAAADLYDLGQDAQARGAFRPCSAAATSTSAMI